MRLYETDWDAPGGAAQVDVDYPDEIIAAFMNWIRKTTAWRENPELVERRVLKLNRDLADVRNARALEHAVQGRDAVEAITTPSVVTVADKRRASLAKARAAKKAKKLQEA